MTSSLEISEQEAAANAKAPRVSLDDIHDAIDAVYYVNGRDAVSKDALPVLALLTLCFVVMRNGFVFVGKSAPASAENFNRDLGRKFAYEDALRQIWSFMGFALRDKLHNQGGNKENDHAA